MCSDLAEARLPIQQCGSELSWWIGGTRSHCEQLKITYMNSLGLAAPILRNMEAYGCMYVVNGSGADEAVLVIRCSGLYFEQSRQGKDVAQLLGLNVGLLNSVWTHDCEAFMLARGDDIVIIAAWLRAALLVTWIAPYMDL